MTLRNVLTDAGTVMLSVRDHIIAACVVPDSLCWLSLDETNEGPQGAERYAYITPLEQVADQPLVTGGGVDTTWINGLFQVSVFRRLWVDRVTRADDSLTDATLGLMKTQQQLLTSLQLFDPLTDDGRFLFAEPMRLERFRFPIGNDRLNYRAVVSAWRISYLQNLS